MAIFNPSEPITSDVAVKLIADIQHTNEIDINDGYDKTRLEAAESKGLIESKTRENGEVFFLPTDKGEHVLDEIVTARIKYLSAAKKRSAEFEKEFGVSEEWAVILLCDVDHEPPIIPEEDYFEIGLAKMHELISGEDEPFAVTENGKEQLLEIIEHLDDEDYDPFDNAEE